MAVSTYYYPAANGGGEFLPGGQTKRVRMFTRTKMMYILAALPLIMSDHVKAEVLETIPYANYEGEASSFNGLSQDLKQQLYGPSFDLNSSNSGPGGAISSSSSRLMSSPSPILSVQAQQNAPFPPIVSPGEAAGSNSSSVASANMSYFFRVVGPQANIPVLVNALGGFSIGTTTAGLGDVQAFATMTIESSQFILDDTIAFSQAEYASSPVITQTGTGKVTGDLQTGVSGSFKENSIYMFEANRTYSVGLETAVNGAIFASHAANPYDISTPGGSLSESAFIDPTFSIASGVNASLYSIQLSPGIGNSIASGVPEPSTWAMMLLGFGGLGFLGYRKSRKGFATPMLAM